MLVLSRKKNEQIVIGDQITLTVVMIRGGSVRLGIDAPAKMSIARSPSSGSREAPDKGNAAETPPSLE